MPLEYDFPCVSLDEVFLGLMPSQRGQTLSILNKSIGKCRLNCEENNPLWISLRTTILWYKAH